MKKLILSVAVAAMAVTANAQKLRETDVPAAVKESFKKLHPNTTAKWEKEKNNYEAEFDLNKVETSVVIGPNGQLLETETEISVTALPAAVNEYVTKNAAGKKIKEASKIVDDKNVVTYEAEIEGADYIFDANGAFIKKEIENKD